MTDKDSKDLLFENANNVDYVALSFVQDPADIRQIKSMIKALGSDVPVVAKIEKLPAIDTIDEIAKEADGLMVARGDLGVEANVKSSNHTHHHQGGHQAWQASDHCDSDARTVIKTRELVSLKLLTLPTGFWWSRLFDAVRRSSQWSVPSRSCIPNVGYYSWSRVLDIQKTIAIQLAGQTFSQGLGSQWINRYLGFEAADALNAKAIVCLTLSGSIAKSISKWRPKTPIIAISPRKDVSQRLALVWGIHGIPNPSFYNTDSLLQDLPRVLKELNVAKSGDVVVITAGIPINKMKPTNMIKINRIP